MRVHLIKKLTVQNYVISHASVKSSFENWFTAVKYAGWETPHDIRRTFRTADLLGNASNRVVFDIGGNNYRMICKYYFLATHVHLFVCWIGTHTEYDKLCEQGLQFTVYVY